MRKTVYKPDKPVVLVGMTGAGKSSVAALLAEKLSVDIYDSDQMIAQEQGKSIADIFEKYGEPVFRDLEKRMITTFLERGPCVIATGGGAVTVPETWRTIKGKSCIRLAENRS